jgi:hypothetical protein
MDGPNALATTLQNQGGPCFCVAAASHQDHTARRSRIDEYYIYVDIQYII